MTCNTDKERLAQLNTTIECLLRERKELKEKILKDQPIQFCENVKNFYKLKWVEDYLGMPTVELKGNSWFGGLADEIDGAGYIVYISVYSDLTGTTRLSLKKRQPLSPHFY